jgi:ubiquinone/menaquinone biosynthesis C-methylase UbiE
MAINKAWWEPESETDAWQKIIMADQEDPDDSARTAAIILDGIAGGETALEIGCGVGRLMKEMVQKFQRVYGVDLAEGMVEHSKNYLRLFPQCRVLLGDGEHLPVDSDSIDFIYSFIAFQHMPSLDVVRTNIEETARVLRPGGVCRIQTAKGVLHYCKDRESDQYLFQNEQAFLDLFVQAGLRGTVKTGLIHSATIWVTAKKD